MWRSSPAYATAAHSLSASSPGEMAPRPSVDPMEAQPKFGSFSLLLELQEANRIGSSLLGSLYSASVPHPRIVRLDGRTSHTVLATPAERVAIVVQRNHVNLRPSAVAGSISVIALGAHPG